MSYADRIRAELCEVTVKKPCCERALLLGLFADAVCSEKTVTLTLRGEEIADFVESVMKKRFKNAGVVREGLTVGGRRVCKLTVASPAALRLIELLATVARSQNGEPSAALGLACEGCRSAFLRGAFLASATVNDPRRSIHAELSFHLEASADLLAAFLSEEGYPPRRVTRKNAYGVYYKDGNSAEYILALAGASRMSMDMMNVRIEREIRNQENRATNCVAKNIEKSVSAAARQMAAIEKLTLSGMLAQLPEAIRYTALLRAENPDATLEELRLLHDPPITKSGLNHRLQKIIEQGEKI